MVAATIFGSTVLAPGAWGERKQRMPPRGLLCLAPLQSQGCAKWMNVGGCEGGSRFLSNRFLLVFVCSRLTFCSENSLGRVVDTVLKLCHRFLGLELHTSYACQPMFFLQFLICRTIIYFQFQVENTDENTDDARIYAAALNRDC